MSLCGIDKLANTASLHHFGALVSHHFVERRLIANRRYSRITWTSNMTTQMTSLALETNAPEREVFEKSIIYLACPYTDPDGSVREQRFRAATMAAASLIRRGYIVYSPITMTHPIDEILAGDLATLGSEYWVTFDEAFIGLCSELVVLKVNGWDRSAGVQREIENFEAQGKPVRFIAPDEYVVSL